MILSRKNCPECEASVDRTHYARHLKSHKVQFQCKYCPSASFKRRDSYIRHLKVHPISDSDDVEDHAPIVQTAKRTMTSQPSSNHPVNILAQPFTANEKQLNRNLLNFKVNTPAFNNKVQSGEFIHPFSCKVLGPRGSGKTSFTVSYIEKVACFRFPKIFIVTTSPNQLLYKSLKENERIFFVSLDEFESIVESESDVLIVLDDVMKEARCNGTLEALFTKGRHEMISVMSLEQDPFYSSHIERRNADYFVLTRMRDTSCLHELYKKFCRDIQQWRFIELYEFSVSKPLGYLIIDLVSHSFKYRLNSLNLYFNVTTFKANHISAGDDDDELTKELDVEKAKVNTELMRRFNACAGQTFNTKKFHATEESQQQVSHWLESPQDNRDTILTIGPSQQTPQPPQSTPDNTQSYSDNYEDSRFD